MKTLATRLLTAPPALGDGDLASVWTTDADEKTVLSTQRGWSYEDIVGNVIPQR